MCAFIVTYHNKQFKDLQYSLFFFFKNFFRATGDIKVIIYLINTVFSFNKYINVLFEL